MRRPSSHYARRKILRFRFAQIILNAIALFGLGAGLTVYFKGITIHTNYITNTE